MLINIWRYSHFALAVSSCLFVFLATATGLILAFEPIQTKLQPNKIKGGEEASLAEVIDALSARYDEVLELEVDVNYFVKASVISMDESADGNFYINPRTGEKLADVAKKKPFFKWITNLHRSLFLKTLGRIFVGAASFLLFLIAFSGSILLIKRQKGIRRFFSRIIKEDFAQYYHVVLSRATLIPILIITLTGVYLSLWRFSIIPEAEGRNIAFEPEAAAPERPFSDFAVFRNTKLKEVRKLEFPFSDDPDEYFLLSLRDRELKINQKTGAVVSALKYPFANRLSEWSFNLHTGAGSIGWSVILAIASVNILFFMYSGGIISYRRIKSKIKNKFSADEAEIVILIGSENGGTRRFGGVLQKQLLQKGKKVFLDDLNHYQTYLQLKNLVVLTSTYGEGDPPANATEFLSLLEKTPLSRPFQYSVVGFGSLAYPNFCQYALDVEEALAKNEYGRASSPPVLIHNKSWPNFKKWAESWSKKTDNPFSLPAQLKTKKEKLYSFQILDKRFVKDPYDETFILKLKPLKKLKFQSGDLLAIYPPNDPIERLYSIGKYAEGHILLSIKRHSLGLCSNYLNDLSVGSTFKAALRKNKDFHFPKKAKTVNLIANGTGLAPFLGMIHEKRDASVQLYWGGRTFASFELYKPFIEKASGNGLDRRFETAFSKENTDCRYVQDLLKKDEEAIARQLSSGGVFMICGSTTMEKGVLQLLESISLKYSQQRLDVYWKSGQILTDCY